MVAVVTFDDACPPGQVADALAARGLAWEVVAADGALPDAAPDAVVVLGGPQGAYEEADHPYLASVKAWLVRLVDADVPVLGICLGAQLLADALGGHAHRAPIREVGVLPVEVVDPDDPLADHLAGSWVFVHQDTFSLPEGASLIARSSYPAAFRIGSAVGLQLHPEADPAIVAGWLARSNGPARWSETDPERLMDDVRAAEDLTQRGRALVGAWLDEAIPAP